MTDDSVEQKFEELTRDVNVQLHSLLTYIEKSFQIPSEASAWSRMSSSELVAQNVLAAYLSLAERFYEDFKSDLMTAYRKHQDDTTLSDRLSDADVPILMQRALDKLTAEWTRVYGFIAATEAKTTSETHRIMTQLSPLISAASREVGFSPESFPVIPQFGTVYSLGFFNYADDFLALNLPITALQSPWEWTIFWHEIAGQKVRLLKKSRMEFLSIVRELFVEMKRDIERQLQQSPVQNQGEEAETVFQHNIRLAIPMILQYTIPLSQLNSLTQEQKQRFEDALVKYVYEDYMDSPNPAHIELNKTRKFTQDLSSPPNEYPLLMFSFEDLLTDILEDVRLQQKKSVMEELREAHRESLKISKRETADNAQEIEIMTRLFIAWEKALSLEENLTKQRKALSDEGWSSDWLEELFEDSFSVLNFDFTFLTIFDKILHRHADGGKDLRHPPHHIRLATAAALKLMAFEPALIEQEPPQADAFPLTLSTEVRSSLMKYFPGTLSVDSQAVVWRAAKKFLAMHQRMKMPQSATDNSVGQIKAAISDAMKTHIATNLDTPESIAQLVKAVMSVLEKYIRNRRQRRQAVESKDQIAPFPWNTTYKEKIDTLLKGRKFIGNAHKPGYRELLELSFSDVDFLGATITDVRLNGRSLNWTINWMTVLSSGVKDMNLEGPVTYKVDGNTRGTTIPNWNVDFGNSAYKL
jgi:hypothetical protein